MMVSESNRILVKVVLRFIGLAGLVLLFWGFGDLTADILIFLGITWLRITTIGTIITSIGLMVSVVAIDALIDRLFLVMEKKAPLEQTGK